MTHGLAHNNLFIPPLQVAAHLDAVVVRANRPRPPDLVRLDALALHIQVFYELDARQPRRQQCRDLVVVDGDAGLDFCAISAIGSVSRMIMSRVSLRLIVLRTLCGVSP